MLNLLRVLLFLLLTSLVAYRGRQRDLRDRPLALLLAYISLGDLIVSYGLWQLVTSVAGAPIRRVVVWMIDVIYVSYYGAYVTTAWRYRNGRWPARLWRWAVGLACFCALLQAIHIAQLETIGLWENDLSIRWITLQLGCFGLSVLAAVIHAGTLRNTITIAPAHWYLTSAILICLVQMIVVFSPQTMNLYDIGVIVWLISGVIFYAILIRFPRLGRVPS